MSGRFKVSLLFKKYKCIVFMVFDLVFEQMCSIFAPCVGLAALLKFYSEL